MAQFADTTFIRQDVAKTKHGLGDSTIKLLVKTYDGTTKEVDTRSTLNSAHAMERKKSKVFDPLGLVAPVVFVMKFLMQEI